VCGCDNALRCREMGCWESVCCCFAVYMSPGKCFSITPWFPILAIALVATSGGFVLQGAEMVTLSVGVEISRRVISISQITVAAIILLDLVFAYSVWSNKMRIHNMHAFAEGCRGYRIKDAKGCCSKMLRCVCKMYNLILAWLVWLTVILAIVLCTAVCWSAGVSLSLVALCQISEDAVDTLLDELVRLDASVNEEVPVRDFIYVVPGTNASAVCAQDGDMTLGSFYMLGGGPVALLAQIIIVVSFNVVAEVSWRHRKDQHRMGGRGEGDDSPLHSNGNVTNDVEMRRQQIANSAKFRSAGTEGGGGGGGGFATNYPTFNDPNANWAQSMPGAPGSPYTSQGSSFQHNQHTTQDI